MKKMLLCSLMGLTVTLASCAMFGQQTKPGDLYADLQPEAIKAVMARVADWQMDNPSKHNLTDWTHGALLAGMMAWAQMADSDKYDQALMEFGRKTNWKPGRRIYHADDHTVAQMYIDMFKIHKDPDMIQPIIERFDYILANQPQTDLKMGTKNSQNRWNWCDALFMAPPVWARLARITGDSKYLDYMNTEWWAVTEYLFDPSEGLYFRDSNYFDKKEANGQKIFWSRGNGWSFAGLARVLEELPLDYPDKPKYIALYKEMAAKIVAIQPEEGLWHSSLLDPASYPSVETSGSGFYCYGLAWGINKGLLDEKTYLPAVVKAWKGLTDCVHSDGKLGYVQPIGADPRHVQADQTEIYGVGAFLLAGSEVYKMAVRKGQKVTTVVVTNPGLFFRDSETVSVDGGADLSVFDLQTNKLLVTQPLKGQLLFQTDLAPGQKKTFWIMPQPDGLKQPVTDKTTFCGFFPQRKDDFAWENDKVCFRMYGPALEYETITCGVDAWGKNVPYPIFEKMITAELEKGISYHIDHGEGGDFYKVGPTLGCGGMAPFVGGKVVLPPHNFVDWKVLANGPIRSVFQLTYSPWQAGSYTVGETLTISIDLGSNLFRAECDFDTKTKTLPLAAGIVLRDSSDRTWNVENVIGYWLPADNNAGQMGCGVVFSNDYAAETVKADSHLLLTVGQNVRKPVVYYAGSCWDKNEEFNQFEKWQAYLMNFKKRLDTPVDVISKTIK
jgi:rhamnogalacturonyl hydrolase YesR